MKLLMHNDNLSFQKRARFAVLSITIFAAAWFVIAGMEIVSPIFLPAPQTAAVAAAVLVKDFGLLGDIAASMYRIISGFMLACAVAIPLGLLLGVNMTLRAVVEPIIGFARYIPPSALVPLFILWFGIGDLEKIFLIFAGVTPYLAILVFDVVTRTSRDTIAAGYTLGANGLQIIRHIILPQSMPGIWDAMRLMFGAAWTFVVLAEIVASTSGLGHIIITSQRFLQTENVIAAVLVIGALGLFTDYLFAWSYRKFFPWAEKVIYA